LIAASEDTEYLKVYDSVINDFISEISPDFITDSLTCKALKDHSIAYFSMEFALHRSIPIYAGGLGVLACLVESCERIYPIDYPTFFHTPYVEGICRTIVLALC
jgi:glucan phosphorylase